MHLLCAARPIWLAHGGMPVVATPDTLDVRQMVAISRKLYPELESVLRTHSEAGAQLIDRENAGPVLLAAHELALAMRRHVLEFVEDSEAIHH
jgi:CPA2 family monovalent cation:H+ antiporter-2